ncbi:hypothetical protein [Massilia sp. GCM10023247]|uniref:hypothetical protein n=1 Tax=Massilia sp. GCM10023247 TaxID=3252643 RepID=UPI00360F34D3
MKNEILIPWSPQDSTIISKVLFEKIIYGGEGMTIELREAAGAKRPLSLSFPELPTAVRVTNESLRLASLPALSPNANTSFFIVENSRLLEWLNSESLNIYAKDPLFHLAIITDEWIDLICNEQPILAFRTDEVLEEVPGLRDK